MLCCCLRGLGWGKPDAIATECNVSSGFCEPPMPDSALNSGNSKRAWLFACFLNVCLFCLDLHVHMQRARERERERHTNKQTNKHTCVYVCMYVCMYIYT